MSNVVISDAESQTIIVQDSGTQGIPGPAVDLDELLNVNTSAKADGEALIWDVDTSSWVTGTFGPEGSTATAIATHASAIDPHGDRAYALSLVDDLSGVSNPSTARTNLGLGSASTRSDSYFAIAAAGTPTGGSSGQVLTKNSGTDYDFSWSSVASSVTSVNGYTGIVVLTASDITGFGSAALADTTDFDAAGTASTAVGVHAAASDPHGDRAYALGLVDDLSGVSNASTARTNLGLGSAATQASSAFDAAGAATAAQSAAIAASAQRASNLSDLADAGTARTNLGLGAMATQAAVTLTGDVTGSGAGSFVATLATVATAGTTGDSTHVPGVTIDAKGRVTSISSNAIADTTTITGNAQTADYTLVLTDAGKCVEMNKATAVTCTVPTNATVAFPTGTVIEVCQLGAGAVTVAAAGGVTLDGGTAITSARYQSLFLRKRATDEWVLTGSVQLGEIGYAAITADVTQAAVGNALVAGLSTTITAPGGRPLNIVVSAELKQSASGSGAAMTIEEDGTQIVEIALIAAAANQAVAVERTVRRTPAAGLHTYRVRLYATTSGTATLIAAPANPAFIQVVQV